MLSACHYCLETVQSAIQEDTTANKDRYVCRYIFRDVRKHGTACVGYAMSSSCNVICVLSSIHSLLRYDELGANIDEFCRKFNHSVFYNMPEVLELPPSVEPVEAIPKERESILQKLENDILPAIALNFDRFCNTPEILLKYDNSIRSIARMYSVDRKQVLSLLDHMNDTELEVLYLKSVRQHKNAEMMIAAFDGLILDHYDMSSIYVCIIALLDKLRTRKCGRFKAARYAIGRVAFSLFHEKGYNPPPYLFANSCPIPQF